MEVIEIFMGGPQNIVYSLNGGHVSHKSTLENEAKHWAIFVWEEREITCV